jgi:hypothetical protein
MSPTMAAPRKGGCGCGGGSVPASSGCGCGCGGTAKCETCATETISRPRFFAGQLLTEEDLQLLGDYVSTKSRLHNRYLFGDGVVCGLQLTCDPCGSGLVRVSPGYAIDCCGNDIVVQCPQTLDINRLVRELKQRQGVDCADPCADREVASPAAPDKRTPRVAISAGEGQGDTLPTPKAEETTALNRREYCLYVRYCETKTDPVAPYSTGDPCAPTAGCSETRIREGFRFELRCRSKPRIPPNFLSAVCACFEDFPEFRNMQRTVVTVRKHTLEARDAVRRARSEGAAAFTAADVDTLVGAFKQIDTDIPRRYEAAVARREQPPAAEPPAEGAEGPRAADVGAAIGRERARPGREEIDDYVNASREATIALGRYLAADEAVRARVMEERPDLRAAIVDAPHVIRRLRARIEPELQAALPTELERETVRAHLQVADRLASGLGGAALPREELASISQGLVVSPSAAHRVAARLEPVRQWLLDRLDRNPHVTDCTLRRDVRLLDLSGTNVPPRTTQEKELEELGDAVEELAELLLRYARSCICSALNPVCQPCEDPSVLLACLWVEDCEVLTICNLERKFVLNGVSLRYWLPLIDVLGERVEKLCCPALPCPDELPDDEEDDQRRPFSRVSWEDIGMDVLREMVDRYCEEGSEKYFPGVGAMLLASARRSMPYRAGAAATVHPLRMEREFNLAAAESDRRMSELEARLRVVETNLEAAPRRRPQR